MAKQQSVTVENPHEAPVIDADELIKAKVREVLPMDTSLYAVYRGDHTNGHTRWDLYVIEVDHQNDYDSCYVASTRLLCVSPLIAAFMRTNQYGSALLIATEEGKGPTTSLGVYAARLATTLGYTSTFPVITL